MHGGIIAGVGLTRAGCNVSIFYGKEKRMQENKVAFIICYNNELYMQECMNYISWLKVPDGMETEVLGISDADSMTAGYNAAMHESDAKYKVYMHQDVFITNENFISDMLSVFQQNPEYGLLGVLGSDRAVEDGCYWDKWNMGKTCVCDTMLTGYVAYAQAETPVSEAVAVDGLLMMTQFDVEWRTDLFDGFDMYDVSQSMEFRRAGYKVGVVAQERPWCLHDCGHSKLKQYDKYRERFCREYGYQYRKDEQIALNLMREQQLNEMILPLLEDAINAGDVPRAVQYKEMALKFYPYCTKLGILACICNIMGTEWQEGENQGFYRQGETAEALICKYQRYKFFLRRLEYERPIDGMEEVLSDIAGNQLDTLGAEKCLTRCVCGDAEQVLHMLTWYLEDYFGRRMDLKEKDEEPVHIPEESTGTILNFIQVIRMEIEQSRYMTDSEKCVREVFGTLKILRNATEIPLDDEVYGQYFEIVMKKEQKKEAFWQACLKWLDKVDIRCREA